jgi:hypothetical protein
MWYKLLFKRQTDDVIVTLDASAAFDRVNVLEFIAKLIDRNVPL